MKYQLSYLVNSKTENMIIEAKSYQNARDSFHNLIGAELIEIREYKYEDKKIVKDDGDYIHSKTAKISVLNGGLNSIKIPKIKKTITDDEFESLILNTIKIDTKKPDKIEIKTTFK